jgi:hypothetical protein
MVKYYQFGPLKFRKNGEEKSFQNGNLAIMADNNQITILERIQMGE